MNKDEILAKSRAENQNQDVYELEVQSKAQSFGNIGMLLLAFLLCALKYLGTGRIDIGVFCLLNASLAISTWYEWAKLKRKKDLAQAFLYTILVPVLLAGYILLEVL